MAVWAGGIVEKVASALAGRVAVHCALIRNTELAAPSEGRDAVVSSRFASGLIVHAVQIRVAADALGTGGLGDRAKEYCREG